MARLLTWGGEEGVVDGFTQVLASGTVTLNSTAGVPHSGVYCGQMTATSSHLTRATAAAVTAGTYFWRGYLRVASYPPSSAIEIVGWGNQAGAYTQGGGILMTTAGRLTLSNVLIPASVDTTTVLTADTWYRVELRHLLSATVGELQLKLYLGDSLTVLDDISTTVGNTLPTNYGRIRWGKTQLTSGTFTALWDDVAWNDDSGTAPHNTWCGPGKTAILTPDADVVNTWTDELAATSSYLKINKYPGTTIDTTYNVQTTTLNQVERFGLTNLGADVPFDATMRVFDVMARVGGDTTSTTSMQLRAWDETPTAIIGPTVACNTTAGTFKVVLTSERLVVDLTSPAKTKSHINNWSVGYENITELATRDRRVSALWVNVEWIEGSGVPPPADTPNASAGSRSIGVFSPRGTTQPAPSGWA